MLPSRGVLSGLPRTCSMQRSSNGRSRASSSRRPGPPDEETRGVSRARTPAGGIVGGRARSAEREAPGSTQGPFSGSNRLLPVLPGHLLSKQNAGEHTSGHNL
jgi:hypothetical protein